MKRIVFILSVVFLASCSTTKSQVSKKKSYFSKFENFYMGEVEVITDVNNYNSSEEYPMWGFEQFL